MKTKIMALALGAFVVSGVFAETILTIDDAVAMAIENNLSLRRAEIDTAAAGRRAGRA